MPWIDTSDIVDVMWDRGSAWSHYDDVSSDMETMRIMDRFSMEQAWHIN
jgi:hypothetical protein